MRIFRSREKQAVSQKTQGHLPWPITLTGRLLGLQSLGFIALAFYVAPTPPIRTHDFNEVWLAGLYILLAFLSATAALGLLRLRPLAWDLAMLLEGAALLQALTAYLAERPFYIYLQMLYGIIAVLNLNNPRLRHSFPTEIIEAQTETQKEPPA